MLISWRFRAAPRLRVGLVFFAPTGYVCSPAPTSDRHRFSPAGSSEQRFRTSGSLRERMIAPQTADIFEKDQVLTMIAMEELHEEERLVRGSRQIESVLNAIFLPCLSSDRQQVHRFGEARD